MVFLEKWDEFLTSAKALFLQNPDQTRYTVKFRRSDSSLVAKVTDDKVCLKFRAANASDLKRVEKLNGLFLRLMSSPKVDADALAAIDDEKSGAAAPKKVKHVA